MPLKQLADKAVDQIDTAISVSLSDQERDDVSHIVEQAIFDAVAQLHVRYEGVVRAHSGPEADTAHKIAEEMRRTQTALIANLCAMR